MNVLLIGRSKKEGRLSPILLAQADSLVKEGIQISFFAVERGGISGYFNARTSLRKLTRTSQYDLFHAHYYTSGILASLSGAKPLVVSLMGSELKSGIAVRSIVRFFVNRIWVRTIVKSLAMFNDVGNNQRVRIIPNGIDLQAFRPLDKIKCREIVGFDSSSKHILFLADPRRKEKNFTLASRAVSLLSDNKVVLHTLYSIDHNEVPVYMAASDLLLLTSTHEGSPNVIKEAMACNLPIVSTPVGDVQDVICNTEGCFITGFDSMDVANKIKQALEFNKRTAGRIRMGRFDSKVIASSIIKLYKEVTN